MNEHIPDVTLLWNVTLEYYQWEKLGAQYCPFNIIITIKLIIYAPT